MNVDVIGCLMETGLGVVEETITIVSGRVKFQNPESIYFQYPNYSNLTKLILNTCLRQTLFTNSAGD